jgi:hypothetical protein
MRRLFVIVFSVLAVSATSQIASAQFYKPVVTLHGIITNKAGKPVSARVSVRDAADTSQEIVASTTNSGTGRYLAIIKPSHEYLVVVRGDSMSPQSVRISTPVADRNAEVVKDFTMVPLEPAHKKPAKATKAPKAKKKVTKKKK